LSCTSGIALDLLSKFCAATPVGCYDISANPTCLPLRGQPVFQVLVKKTRTTRELARRADTAFLRINGGLQGQASIWRPGGGGVARGAQGSVHPLPFYCSSSAVSRSSWAR
jgi:hypothetical protein